MSLCSGETPVVRNVCLQRSVRWTNQTLNTSPTRELHTATCCFLCCCLLCCCLFCWWWCFLCCCCCFLPPLLLLTTECIWNCSSRASPPALQPCCTGFIELARQSGGRGDARPELPVLEGLPIVAPVPARTNGQCQHRRISVRNLLTAGTVRGKSSERAADCVSDGIAAVSTRRFASASLLPVHMQHLILRNAHSVTCIQQFKLSDTYTAPDPAPGTQQWPVTSSCLAQI